MSHPSDHSPQDPTELEQLTAQNRALQQRIAVLEAQLQTREQASGEGTGEGIPATVLPDDDSLRQAYKMEVLGTFTAGIAHDFNNVLSVMLGYADLSLYDIPQGSAAWHNLQEILQAGRRAKDLIRQMLSFIRRDQTPAQPTGSLRRFLRI
ncbi:MAG: hypothetical protein ETSY1_10660 [Candidatus Entotheonella factor]|uniref:histidine kinase n=1 Tax=Entotheonella factor TaxID=1429438 RepID=W4LT44_ENTF1|nr:histidine kinase dimerization/phospho-acceptor domain-containing protein [Candidatus Entotheonella palauensis]ETX00607.1 MAG: hypothetical protein ETSY1_10660 [Candidatus Entotheonella factor]